MKGYISICIILFVSAFLLLGIFHYAIEDYKHKSVVLTATESARAASIENVDKSLRVSSGEVILSTDNFEKDFKRLFAKNTNIVLKNPSYTFDYLKEKDSDSLKAVRVKIKNEGVSYQATLVSDIETNKEEKK
ncbi:hypothetical protein KYX44_000611 [Listeria monocytogenes]|nr:hypothetical protein [Listeria monocytogenes]